MRRKTMYRALQGYLATTTLHGFKYLQSPHHSDRVVWLVNCCACACSAGVLFAVLWTRFVQVPIILSLDSGEVSGAIPSVAVCRMAVAAAADLSGHLTNNGSITIVSALTSLLQGRPVPDYQLYYLEHLLTSNNMTLSDALLKGFNCTEVVRQCSVNRQKVPCRRITHRDLTMMGACCVFRTWRRFPNGRRFLPKLKIRELDIILKTLDGDSIPGYDVYRDIDGIGWVKANTILPGFGYQDTMVFHLIRGYESVNLIDSTCNSDKQYSRTACRAACAETACGCTDPMMMYDDEVMQSNLPPCSIARTICLRTYDLEKCNCLPSCKQITTQSTFSQTTLGAVKFMLDPLYSDFDMNRSIAFNMRVTAGGSHVFARVPTETWLTLLSSLGGVFSMFLGVSLFSALELLYFLLVRIPVAIRRSPEITIPSAVPAVPKMHRKRRPPLVS